MDEEPNRTALSLQYTRRWLTPLGASLYLAMTWSSAIRYWRGMRSRWKGRVYAAAGETVASLRQEH